jgi:hypothetical protein
MPAPLAKAYVRTYLPGRPTADHLEAQPTAQQLREPSRVSEQGPRDALDEKVNRVNEAPGHVLSWQLSGQPGSRDRRGSEGVPMRIT